jgi:hypothetical protein
MRKFTEKVAHFNILLKSRRALLTIILSVVLVNTGIYILTDYFPVTESIQSRKDATGFCHPYASQFIYFYYYTGYFPLSTLDTNLIFSKEEAVNQILVNGESLTMEYKHWARLGENARIWTFIPNAVLKCSPEKPSVKLFNAIIFTLSLIIFFAGFKKSDKPLFGLIIIALINFTPFFIYEVYSRENIFGILASGFLMVTGLNINVLFNKNPGFIKFLFPAIISGLLIGLFSEIRNETSNILVSIILIYLLANNMKLYLRGGLIILILLSFLGSKNLIKYYFDNNFAKTTELVSQFKGHVYTGGRIGGHKFWHPVFCGLGDFGQKYGYEWNDRVAYKYAVPVLNEKYNMDIKYSGELYTDQYYDTAGLYYIKFDEIPEYENVVKEKVLSDIKSDPGWYAEIIGKRIVRNLNRTLPFPFVGWLILPLIYILIRRKNREMLKLLIISLPLSATSVLIFSDKGVTYNSMFPYFIITILLYEAFRKKKSPEINKQ